MLRVELIAHTPEPERLVAAAAKNCYSAAGVGELMTGSSAQEREAYIDMLREIGHESPVEHASFTFAIEGVSRSLLAQITRHRIASFSVQSQRYVRENDFAYVIPPAIARDEQAKALYERTMADIQKSYDALRDMLVCAHISAAPHTGESDREARRLASKLANEDARYVLPNACETKIVMTMNVRSLYNFFRLRCCNRAQWEIRELAWRMRALCLEAAPALFERTGPACLSGPCSEGKMSCGRPQEARERARV